jgi:bifunctional non-homologous end joining protein LigD
MARLEEYRRKRDFARTPEPSGQDGVAAKDSGIFVVHKHAARRLHYDLRLEHEGVLESWALPKGPGLTPGERRLAVHVEDHPLEYGDFEGVIPEGEYGTGTVMLWDRGRWHAKRRESGRIDFVLEGHKLRGSWSLVRMHGRTAKEGDNWLLIKRRDRDVPRNPDDGLVPSELADRSVVSGRRLEEIAADRDRTWTSGGKATPSRGPLQPEALEGTHPGALPPAPHPQLATLAEAVPQNGGWIHEIKFDGYRILARIEAREVRLISRNGQDWTERFPAIAALLTNIEATDALLDGEVVALGADGISSFRRLQEALSAHHTGGLIYQTFDLLHLNGFDLTGVALHARKDALAALLDASGLTGSARVRFTDHIEGRGRDFLNGVCRLGLEGVVSKREDGSYQEGRTTEWLKVKCTRHEELVIGGYTDPSGARAGFGALLVGAYADGRLIYTNRVGTGFSDQQLATLHPRLEALETARSPFDPAPRQRGVHWVRPELVAELEYTEWTRGGALRHPSFRGLRDDRDPAEIRLPAAAAGALGAASPARLRAAGAADGSAVAGVRLTHPDRVLYPDQGVTKLALAHYYEEVADWLLPYLARRPLSLVRCPQGPEEQCFFQKHPGATAAKGVPRIEIAEREGRRPYLYVDRLRDLIALVQAGVLELHPWGSRVDDIERPDLLVFDLDPGPRVGWTRVLRTASAVRDRLANLGLTSFVRTTGGKGLHLVVPLVPSCDWDEAKAFTRGVAEAQAHDDPRRITANMSKAKRQGRIFLDYLRNGRGATAVASYSPRARAGATVAVPVRWEELSPALTSDRYDIENLRRRLRALDADPWEGFEDARRPLTREMMAAVGAAEAGA